MTTQMIASPTLAAPSESRDVVRELIRLIQSDGFAVGDRLPSIRQLADRFEVSASVLRDALVQVQTLGLIKILPRSGAFVQAVDYAPLVDAFAETLEGAVMQVDHNLFHLLEARQVVETECVRRAAGRRRLEDLLPLRDALESMDAALDQMHSPSSDQARRDFVEADIRFHLAIASISGNPVLVTLLRSLLGLLRPQLAQIPWNPERRDVTQAGHEELYDRLLAGDADGACESMRTHLQVAYDGLLKRVWSRGGASSKSGGSGRTETTDE